MYPLVAPPISDTGAWTWPRTLQRWLDINPVTKLTRTSTYIVLPNFTTLNTWNGYSDIVASFNCEAPNNFSLSGTLSQVPLSVNYALCISYRVGSVVTRYLLWDAQGSKFNQTIPLYVGQPIKKNSRFEVWNTSQGVCSQATAVSFYTTKLGPQDYRYSGDTLLKICDAINTAFSSSLVNTTPTGVVQVTGAGDTDVNGIYNARGTYNGAVYYLLNGSAIDANAPDYGISIFKNPFYNDRWYIKKETALISPRGYRQIDAEAAVSSPDQVITWQTFSGDFPVPTCTAITPSGNLPFNFGTNSTSQTN